MSGSPRRARAALVALSCLLGFGCAPSFQLVDERSAPPYAALVRADEALALRTRRLDIEFADAWPVHVRQIASESPLASQRPVLVLLNGVFSDGGTWRFVTGPLSERFDLLVIDLPGTGLSCGTDPDALPSSTLTLSWIGGRVWQALAGWQARLTVPRATVLVGHSLAGAVILRMLGDPSLRASSQRERSHALGAVLIGSADVGTDAWSPVLVELAKLSDAEVEIGGALGILRSEVEGGVARSVERPRSTALQGEATRMIAALEDRDRRRASQLMLQRIRPIDGDEKPIWSLVQPMVDDHARVDVPVMLLWGRHDDILPLSTAEKLRSEIPRSQLVVIEGARHSVHQEEPLAVAAAILNFADGLAAPPFADR